MLSRHAKTQPNTVTVTWEGSKYRCPTSRCSSEMVSSLRLGQLAAKVKRAWNPSCHLPHPSCIPQHSVIHTFIHFSFHSAKKMTSCNVCIKNTQQHGVDHGLIRSYTVGGFRCCSHTVCQSSISCAALHLAGTMSTTSSSWHLSKTCTMDLSDTCISSTIHFALGAFSVSPDTQ